MRGWGYQGGAYRVPRDGAALSEPVGIAIPNNTVTIIDSFTEDMVLFDSYGYFDPDAPDRLTVPATKAGVFLVDASFGFDDQALAGARAGWIYHYDASDTLKHGGKIGSTYAGSTNGKNHITVSLGAVECAVGDYFQVEVFHVAGSTRNVLVLFSLNRISQ